MFGVVASPYILPGRVRHQQELLGVGDRDVVLDHHVVGQANWSLGPLKIKRNLRRNSRFKHPSQSKVYLGKTTNWAHAFRPNDTNLGNLEC